MCQKSTLLLIAVFTGLSLSWAIKGGAQIISPETHTPYTADILNNDSETRVGEPFFLLLGLRPEKLPLGYSVSILIDVLDSPIGAKPEILTGFPKSRLIMSTVGSYRFSVRVSLMSKSSCGGIDAEELLKQELRLQVNES